MAISKNLKTDFNNALWRDLSVIFKSSLLLHNQCLISHWWQTIILKENSVRIVVLVETKINNFFKTKISRIIYLYLNTLYITSKETNRLLHYSLSYYCENWALKILCLFFSKYFRTSITAPDVIVNSFIIVKQCSVTHFCYYPIYMPCRPWMR